jgi:carbonic anhydrase
MSVVDRLAEHAAGYAPAYRASGMPHIPRLGVAVVVCMDTRLSPYGILGLVEGDAHVIRNAGGLVTDDVLRSLAASQHLLGTTSVMIVQHTQCGLMSTSDEAFAERLRRHAGTEPSWRLHAFADLEESVRAGVRRVRTSPYLPHRDEVRGFAFDVETGELREVTP